MARTFNGSSDKAVSSSVTGLSALPLTFHAWIKPDATTGEEWVFGVADGGLSRPGVRIGKVASDVAACGCLSDANHQSYASGSTTLNTGVWYAITGTVTSGGATEIFVNGTSEGTDAAAASQGLTGLDRVNIGAWERVGDTHFYTGTIAHCAGWDVVLTDDEISALGKGVSPLVIRPASLQRYYPLTGTNSPEIDMIAADHATVTGATSSESPHVIQPWMLNWSRVAAAGGGVAVVNGRLALLGVGA